VTDDTPIDEPLILARPDHTISRANIDENCQKVLYRLDRAGRRGYMVGGAVRDLLLDRKPKDYDVATDARPPEVRRLFRNSRIIGRRFRLAHVYFKEGIVEVATFRRDPDPDAQSGDDGELLITDDNQFGTPREDAFRRDFTVNALFYNIGDYSVIDYVGGIEDLRARRIRAIGDPHVRFQEDPIRMTRACELAGRLGFTIETETQKAIIEQRNEILKASTARLTEEILQILRCRRAGEAMQWMLDLGLIEVFLPEAMGILMAEREGLGDWGEALALLDERAEAGESLPDTAVMGALLLPEILLARHAAEQSRGRELTTAKLRSVIDGVVAPFFLRIGLSKLKAEQVALAVLALDQMERKSDWNPGERMRLANRPYFSDSLLYYEALVRATGADKAKLEPWRELERRRPRESREGGPGDRPPRPRPRRRRRTRKRGSGGARAGSGGSGPTR
jgi:poly(A) polymerase